MESVAYLHVSMHDVAVVHAGKGQEQAVHGIARLSLRVRLLATHLQPESTHEGRYVTSREAGVHQSTIGQSAASR